MSESTDIQLTGGQVRAIELLLTTPNLSDVAAKMNISRQTLYRWLNEDSSFRLRLARREAEELSAATRKLISLCTEATLTLESAMNEENVSSRALRAADIILKRTPLLIQTTAMSVRLASLEEALLGSVQE